MTERISVGQLYPNVLRPAAPKRTDPEQARTTSAAGEKSLNFKDIFQEKLRFSHHAELRLQQRGITLKPEQLDKIGKAIDQAAAKGSKDSLLLMNDLALIVNVKNRTVVTAMEGSNLKDNVFTQIDSAVVIS